MAEPLQAWTTRAEGLVLTVRLAPRAARDAIEGVCEVGGRAHLRVSVTAPPAGGAANDALVRLVARTLGVAKSTVTLRSGLRGRVKTLAVSGDGSALAARLAELCPAA